MFSSKSISGKHAQSLALKVSKLLSVYQRKKYNYVYKSAEVNRTDNNDLFYNIEIIQEAIENNKKISFKYKKPYIEKENRKTPYVVNPYFLINSQGRYYLVCNYDYYDEISNYKLEFIKDIKILDEARKPIRKLNNYANDINITKYINEHFYAFGKKTVNATLKLSSENAAIYVLEWFGSSAKIYKKGDTFYADLSANEMALIYWCLQYGENVELVSPADTRQKIKNTLNDICKKYD